MRVWSTQINPSGELYHVDSITLSFGKAIAGKCYSDTIAPDDEQVVREWVKQMDAMSPAGKHFYGVIETDDAMPTATVARDSFALTVSAYEGLSSIDKSRFLSHYRLGSRLDAENERDAALAEKDEVLRKIGSSAVRESELRQANEEAKALVSELNARIAVLERERDDALRAAGAAVSVAAPEAPAKAKAPKAPKVADAPEAPESK